MQFHVLSFEGPDPYARAGGLASRVGGLTHALAELGFETHLWFVGDPDAPGHESSGSLHLHRWCQWISGHHRAGVYDGEHGKVPDYAASLPSFLIERTLRPHLASGGRSVILAEEWHTVPAVLHLDHLLRESGLDARASLLWNANNVFGFERIDWARLQRAAVVTTVSRYMRQWMRDEIGVDAVAIPNGLSMDAFDPPDAQGVQELRRRFRDRTVLVKMARFDPDKNWLLAIETVAEMKRQGWRPLLVARGGAEAHGAEVMAAARAAGLVVAERRATRPGVPGLLAALEHAGDADVVRLESFVDAEARRTLFRAADTVLANSAHEPFGLVGLEAMAAGGLATTGCSGEDYAVPGRNALVLQTRDPREFTSLFGRLRERPDEAQRLRRAGRRTARQFSWREVIKRDLLPRLDLVGAAG
jgi:glycosyltransferase involved in cell wall biosynthesis